MASCMKQKAGEGWVRLEACGAHGYGYDGEAVCEDW